MSQSPEDVVRGMYEAFARADIEAILNTLDERIDWRAPGTCRMAGASSDATMWGGSSKGSASTGRRSRSRSTTCSARATAWWS